MIHAEEFGSAFQRVLVRACLDDPGLRALVKRFVDAGQLGFTDPGAAWGWRGVAGAEYPTLLMLETESSRIGADDPARVGVTAILTAVVDWRESEYVRGRVVEWARRQVFASAYEESRQAWNAGDVEGAYARMMSRLEEHAAIRLEVADRGWFFEDFDLRQERRQIAAQGLDFFPSGVARIDRAMGGGLHFGELEVPVAYSGTGKTFWCVQRGYMAAWHRRRCLHLVLEGGRGKTEDRYEARFTACLYSAVRRGDINVDAVVIMRRHYAVLRGGLVVRGFADKRVWNVTPDDVLAEISELRRAHGWVPELVVIDYGDIVRGVGDDEKSRQKDAFQKLHALAERVEYPGHPGYAVCAPSQAIRPSHGDDEREHVLKPRDVADCYDKVRVADAIITLNRTVTEAEQEQARVYLGKYRDDEGGVLARVRTDYKRGTFSVVGRDLDDDPGTPSSSEPLAVPY